MATHEHHSRFNIPFFGKASRRIEKGEPEFGFLSPQKFGESIEDSVNFSGQPSGESHGGGLSKMDASFFSLNPFNQANLAH